MGWLFLEISLPMFCFWFQNSFCFLWLFGKHLRELCHSGRVHFAKSLLSCCHFWRAFFGLLCFRHICSQRMNIHRSKCERRLLVGSLHHSFWKTKMLVKHLPPLVSHIVTNLKAKRSKTKNNLAKELQTNSTAIARFPSSDKALLATSSATSSTTSERATAAPPTNATLPANPDPTASNASSTLHNSQRKVFERDKRTN
jgi:hypothetical protein